MDGFFSRARKLLGTSIGTPRPSSPKLTSGRGLLGDSPFGRNPFGGTPFGGTKETTSITIEHGFIKVLVSSGQEVIDYGIGVANPQLFREGLVNDPPRVAGLVRSTIDQMGGAHRRVIGAVPGYQTILGAIELPKTRGLDPEVVIPREARQRFGVSPDMSYITWHQLPDNVDRARWLVLSVSRRSITSVVTTLRTAGLPMTALELRPFALARATNRAEAIIAWTAFDGCEVVIVRGAAPVAYQSAFWGADQIDRTILVNRLTEIVGRAIATYEEQNSEMPLPDQTPLFVTGSPVGMELDVGAEVAASLQRPVEQLSPPLEFPLDFPLNDMIVNVGLALWEA